MIKIRPKVGGRGGIGREKREKNITDRGNCK
jgi:hypothetical protein